ncbi:LOW QUALITY PROTEIN: uncharacterized protein LOC110178374 [Drosophila serrata]|uniref:LOW QUALITY PROTEIN: uncharacterized protein LOC110178374 n=1 Tax=Drosophila serrata TaxID=7274 RepID=UPI000A1CFE69|nr:LOW QUALITY PROTEIN: uncharacterized protein LOC110178374 [Drosophila serrata]
MAIIWRLPWTELLSLVVGVWLCLSLEPNAGARLPNDRLVFPSESQPELESRLQEFDRQMAEVTRLTNVSLLMMPKEAEKGMPRIISTSGSTGNENPPLNTTGKGKEEVKQEGNPLPRETKPSCSESKVITFASDPESNSLRPWDETEVPTTVKIKVVLEPRITLETTRICPEGFTLSNVHCRKMPSSLAETFNKDNLLNK